MILFYHQYCTYIYFVLLDLKHIILLYNLLSNLVYYMLLHNLTPHVVSVAFSFFRGGGGGEGEGGSGSGGDETVFSRLDFALKVFKHSLSLGLHDLFIGQYYGN